MKHMPLTLCWIAVMAVATIAACAKLDLGGNGPVPTPTSSSPVSPTPGACGTPNRNTNLVVVAMGNEISPSSAPGYGTINGYTVVENGSFSSRAPYHPVAQSRCTRANHFEKRAAVHQRRYGRRIPFGRRVQRSLVPEGTLYVPERRGFARGDGGEHRNPVVDRAHQPAG